MTEEKQRKKRKFLFNPLKRPLPYLGLMVAILLLIFQRTIRNYVSDTIGEMMVDAVQESTGGEYKIAYDLVRFDVISKELRISNLSIELDTSVISKEEYLKKKPNLVDIKTPIVVLKLRSILPLVFKDQLLVSFVGAKDPEFNLVKSKQSAAMKDIARQSQTDVIQVISNYFAALEIDSFRVESGGFSIESEDKENAEIPNIHVSEFTTTLKNFRLDSLSPSILLQGMRATTAELEVLKQEIFLPKSNQTIYFNRLWLSSSDSTIQLDSLVITQMPKGNATDKVNLNIQNLKILGFNFERAFNQNDLIVNNITINKPIISYENRSAKEASKEANSGLFKYFHQLKVGSVSFNHGSLLLDVEHKSTVKDLSFELSNYVISPEDWAEKKLISDVQVESFKALQLEQQLPDSIHKAQIESVDYDKISGTLTTNNVRINPISGRNSYATLKSRNLNFSTYTNIKSISLKGIQPEQLLLGQPLEIDSVIVQTPRSSVLQYPLMRVSKNNEPLNIPDFSIKHLITKNGSLKLRQYQKGKSQQTVLNGIGISISSLTPSVLKNGLPENTRISVAAGSFGLKGLGHTATFSNLKTLGLTSVYAGKIVIKPDSISLPYHKLNGEFNNVYLLGFDLKNISNKAFEIDTLIVKSARLDGDFRRDNFESTETLNKIGIAKLSLGNTDLNVKMKKSIINAKGVALNAANILLDSLSGTNKPGYNFDELMAQFVSLRFSDKENASTFTAYDGAYSEQDSTLTAQNLTFVNPGKALRFSADEVRLNAISKAQWFKYNKLRFCKASLVRPTINLRTKQKEANESPTKLDSLVLTGKLKAIDFDTLNIIDGSSLIILPQNRVLEIGKFDGTATRYTIDSLTTLEDAINNLDGTFELSDTQLTGLKDTLTISKTYVDTQAKTLWTDSIYYSSNNTRQSLKILSPGIAIRDMDIPSILKKQISVRQIASRNNHLIIDKVDTSKVTLNNISTSFTLPLGVYVQNASIKNTKLSYTSARRPNHFLDMLQFDIEFDSLKVENNQLFDLNKSVSDIRFRAYSFNLNLPDSLNNISFDTLLASTGKSEIRISNLRLTPRYSKYQYGIKAGFQADWKNMLVETLKFEKVNFEKFTSNTFQCGRVTIDKGYLDLFKDKQLRFPSERVLPMLQDRIKNVKTKIEIDTIEVKNIDISQTTMQSSGATEGSIRFEDTNGIITNITNDTTRIYNNKMMRAEANSMIMGKGKLTANFAFDMLDEDNLFYFDARLGPMEAQEFNSILEATAFVNVRSGNIKSIDLQATANSSYAFGNMSFLYNDLKVETYNKKNLKTKGMGVTLKSFFANTFVVKKNNSKYRLFARRGSMYYERDPARISLDYAAKTALSGVVSSIGARNNSKEIKRIQKEDKQKRDAELKQKKELNKELEKAAKKNTRQNE